MNESTIGAYRILRECGRGAFGTVYLAENAISGQRFALKVLHCSRDERELEGLIRCRECRHGNLLQIHHIDRLPDGRLYYTMDAADDRSGGEGQYQPDTLAARGRIPAGELTGILLKLLDGVEELHRHQIIHRDIKPENILFIRGVPVLGDAGLAAASGSAGAAGTPSFLPKEVLSGKRDPDEASDLFALGRTAYAALTGKSPAEYPQLPGDLPAEAAPVLAFCRAANGMDATLASCRAALNVPPRSNARRCRGAVLLLAVFAAAVAVALPAVRRARETVQRQESGSQVLSSERKPEDPVSQTDAGTDAALKSIGADLTRKMRQLDRDVAASQAGMRAMTRKLSGEEYDAAVAELEKRCPVSPELLERARVRYDTVRREHFRKLNELSPFTEDGAAARARLDGEWKRLEAADALFRLGRQDDALRASVRSFRMTCGVGDLARLEEMFRARQETARQLSDP